MKTILLSVALLLVVVLVKAQPCAISVNIAQDSCPGSVQTFITQISNSNYSQMVCATDVPSLPALAGDTVSAHVYSPCPCIVDPMTSLTVQSVYFSLNGPDSQPCGADIQTWLVSPEGTILTLQTVRPFNSDNNLNTCYCPTFTPAGTDGVIPNVDGPYNSVNYSPEGGLLNFTGEDACADSAEWTLYMNKTDNNCGDTARITAFCIVFAATSTSSNLTYSWSGDSLCLAYLSSLTIANPVFTPPSGIYDCTYYLTVTDSVCGCSGTDSVHVSCSSSSSVESLNSSANALQVSIHNSEITFTYPSSNEKKEIAISDIRGREIIRYKLPQGSTAHNEMLPQISKGVYVARLISNSQHQISNVKFVIE
jgi:hypothetical protein